MTKLSEKDQDFIDENTQTALDSGHHELEYMSPIEIKDYLIQKDAEHKAEVAELHSQIEFKIKECMELAQAWSRHKQSLTQHNKQVAKKAFWWSAEFTHVVPDGRIQKAWEDYLENQIKEQ